MDLEQPLHHRDGETGGTTLTPHQEVEFAQGVMNGLSPRNTYQKVWMTSSAQTPDASLVSPGNQQMTNQLVMALLVGHFEGLVFLPPWIIITFGPHSLHMLYLWGWNVVHALPSPLPIQKGMTPFPKVVRSDLCTKHCAVLQHETRRILRYKALQWWDCDNPHKKCVQADQGAPCPQLPPAQLEQDMLHFLPAEPGPWERFHSWTPGACKAQTTVKSQQHLQMSLPITFKLF